MNLRRSSLIALALGTVGTAKVLESDFAALEQRVITVNMDKEGKLILPKIKKRSPKARRETLLGQLHRLHEEGKISLVEVTQGTHLSLPELIKYRDRLESRFYTRTGRRKS